MNKIDLERFKKSYPLWQKPLEGQMLSARAHSVRPYIRSFNTMERIERERAKGKEINYFLERGAEQHKALPEEMLFDTQADPHELTNIALHPEMAKIKQRLKTELFRWMGTQNDYLTENGPVPFLDVGKRFSLDDSDGRYPYPYAEDQKETLKGKKINPHQSTAPKAE